MDVEWRLQKQQVLQGGVNIGRGFKILPANNMGDALNGIIHDNRSSPIFSFPGSKILTVEPGR